MNSPSAIRKMDLNGLVWGQMVQNLMETYGGVQTSYMVHKKLEQCYQWANEKVGMYKLWLEELMAQQPSLRLACFPQSVTTSCRQLRQLRSESGDRGDQPVDR